MADIQFDEEQQYQPSYQTEQKSLFVRLVLATRIVSTDRQAEYFLLGIVVTLLMLTGVIIFSMGGVAQQTSQMYLDKGRTIDQSQFTHFR